MKLCRGASAHRCSSATSSVHTARGLAVPRPTRRVIGHAAAVVVETPETEESAQPEVLPTSQQVHDLLQTLVTKTEIAEMHLQMGSFELKVRRSHSVGSPPPPPPPPAPAAPAASAPSADFLPALLSLDGPALESVDESLIYVTSPKVGILRRGRYAAGKRVGKGDVVKEGDQVKKGQTLAFVEQLGTYVPVEAPQAGELVNFQVQDGGAVEYGQLVVEIAPFFGGHIIGDKKHA